MVEDRKAFELTESIAEAQRLFIEDFDAWDITDTTCTLNIGGQMSQVTLAQGVGVPATATRREDRGLVKTHKKTPIYRPAQRESQTQRATPKATTWDTAAGDSIFMRRKLESVKRELRASGKVADRDAYRLLVNVRPAVTERYGEAIHWLRERGRDEEARRFELMRQHFPRVRSENQLIAQELIAQRDFRSGRKPDGGREY